MRNVFARQALPMVWDFAESNPFCDSSGSFNNLFHRQIKGFRALGMGHPGVAIQADAAIQTITTNKIVSTDPPYYDNIGYADLSDFFYVWLRRSLQKVFPKIFATVTVPKSSELVATPSRHGGRKGAEKFFLDGMTNAMRRLAEKSKWSYPVTIYYAFKQSEIEQESGVSSTGWEAFLEATIAAGFAISGTWPIRTEKPGRVRENYTNALASSIVLVCRARKNDLPTATRREFVATLQKELPNSFRYLQSSNIAPVDLAQAAIGPGMAIFTRFERVLDLQGNIMCVREALALINNILDQVLAEQEGDYDPDSRWAMAWFEQVGFNEGEFGIAETLSKAKNTSVSGMVDAGILESQRGRVRLLRPEELSDTWDPLTDPRLTTWEIVHHLIRRLANGGEEAAAVVVAKLGTKAENARELAYRLYNLCERKRRAAEAVAYNGLVQSWPEIVRLARESKSTAEQQPRLFDTN